MPQFLIDLHIHTARYSPCAPTHDPEQLIYTLQEKALHGAVLSDHDQLWTVQEVEELLAQSEKGATESTRLYRGVEISTEHAHIVAIGMEDLRDTPPRVPLYRLVDVAREQGAALIWVHPYLNYRELLPPEQHTNIEKYAEGIHAVEVCSSVTRRDLSQRSQLLSEKWGWAPVGGSDAHSSEKVGVAVTAFSFLPKDEKELAKAIIDKKCSVVCPD